MANQKVRRPVQLFVPGRLVFRVKCPKAPKEERGSWENIVWQELFEVVDEHLPPATDSDKHLVKGSGTKIPGKFDPHEIWNRLKEKEPLGVISCGDLLDSDPPISREQYEEAFVTVEIPPADHDEFKKMLDNGHFGPFFEILYTVLEEFKRDNSLGKYFEGNPDAVWPETVSPDWYASGSQYPTVEGGPGTLPAHAQLTGEQGQGYSFPELDKVLPEKPESDAPVHVMILDTVPTKGFLDLLPTPLAGDLNNTVWPKCTLDLDSADKFLRADEVVDKYHDFSQVPTFASHGLFIAETIARCAPDAKLTLVRVLNDYCVGTCSSLLAGLQWVAERVKNGGDNIKGTRVIVNCSLTVRIPCMVREPHEHYQIPNELAGKWPIMKKLNDFPDLVAIMRDSLKAVCDYLHRLGVQSVAAAGNDSEAPGKTSKGLLAEARYPAAFDDVLGVAAAQPPKGSATTTLESYSNLPDDPSKVGLATWGGTTDQLIHDDPAPGEDVYSASPVAGMEGPFIDSTYWDSSARPPDLAANTTGSARWSGTSFATAIISGAIAKVAIYTGKDAQLARQFVEDNSTAVKVTLPDGTSFPYVQVQ